MNFKTFFDIYVTAEFPFKNFPRKTATVSSIVNFGRHQQKSLYIYMYGILILYSNFANTLVALIIYHYYTIFEKSFYF